MSVPGTIRALPRRRGAVAVLFLVWAVWLAFPYFGLGSGSYVRIYDNADSTLAARVALRATDPSHLNTAWNPQPVAGVDQTPVSSYADLDGWLFAILPGWLAYGLVMLAQRFLAGYFTYRLLRDRLGAGILASILAGFLYASFAQMTINEAWAGFTLYDGLSLACLPLFIWALDDQAKWSFRWRVALAIVLGLLLGFGSNYALGVFVIPAVIFWLLVRRRTPVSQAAIVIVVFVASWALSEVPALWASLINAGLSHRAAREVSALSLREAVSAELAWVRGCVVDNEVMVVAAILGAIVTRFRDRKLLVSIGASALIFLLVIVAGIWSTGLRQYVGPLAEFGVNRFYLLAPFALILSGALGLDALAAKLRGRLPAASARRGSVWAASLTVLVLVVLGVLASAHVQLRIAQEMRAGSNYANVYERASLQRLATANKGAPPYRVATVYAPQSFKPPSESTWPELFGQLPAFAWAYGLESADGYVVLYSARYHRFWGALTERALRVDESMSVKYWDWGSRVYLFVPQPGVDWSQRQGLPLPAVVNIDTICDTELLSLANVRYLISPVHIEGDGISLVSADEREKPWPLYVYENTRVLPRYFMVGATRTYADQTTLLKALSDASLEELRSTAFLEARSSAVLDLTSLASPAGDVHLSSYAADDVSLSVQAAGRCVLVGAMNYSPSWHAYVDGREVLTLPVDCAFVGVVVPGGAHRVELRYQPSYASFLAR
jgi:hypothetical protein